ncbi:unnamed protein product [Acanthoscelides obtectus]|uniref:Uncharacterized protein n=1 Tax=Acanthoscelides obtectus TaxID=200917 RepID=A0A9P0L2R7_ACAOB|nr:unnamed protein product [Acanthoscelides obtectus]CAK1630973.1 Protein ZBED8 [Acanthoscelides obtectus]
MNACAFTIINKDNIGVNLCCTYLSLSSKEGMIPTTPESWLDVAKQFEKTWNFPHCLGALDGKHVVIQGPCNTRSEFFNYKSTFSVVLFALVDANYNFLYKRPTLDRMFASTSQRNDDGFRASYNISLLIAKSGKPHTIGEKLILPAVEEVLKTVLHKPASDIIKRIPLSNNTVERRIDEMSSDIESFLCNYLQTTHFSIQLDESTLPDNAALLLAYVHFIMNQEIYEELLFARTLITDSKGESIVHVLKDYFIEKAIPLSNIISVATDGAPAMVGRYRGFISYLKQNMSGVLAIHCVIHRQHLVAKNLSVRLHESVHLVHLVIDAVNRIRSNALNTRLFAQLCEENDEHFHQLLLHTEVRWLSKGLCLTRLFALFEAILEFLDTKDKILKENLMKRNTDIAYLTDLFTKFNMVNLQLQGDSLNLIKTKSILSAFLARVKLMKQNIGQGEFSQFPNLSQTSCQEDDVSTYVQHLNALYSDFESRFEDILTMVIPPWIINPYGDIEETNVIIQEELTELMYREKCRAVMRQRRRDLSVTFIVKDEDENQLGEPLICGDLLLLLLPKSSKKLQFSRRQCKKSDYAYTPPFAGYKNKLRTQEQLKWEEGRVDLPRDKDVRLSKVGSKVINLINHQLFDDSLKTPTFLGTHPGRSSSSGTMGITPPPPPPPPAPMAATLTLPNPSCSSSSGGGGGGRGGD